MEEKNAAGNGVGKVKRVSRAVVKLPFQAKGMGRPPERSVRRAKSGACLDVVGVKKGTTRIRRRVQKARWQGITRRLVSSVGVGSTDPPIVVSSKAKTSN